MFEDTCNSDFYKQEKKSAKNPFTGNEIGNNFIMVIYQFLLRHNFQATAENLVKEADKMGYINFQNCTNINVDPKADPCKEILAAYESGNRRKFFQLWNTLIPEDIKGNKEHQVLTLNLLVHFAVLPKRIQLFCCNQNPSNMKERWYNKKADASELEYFASELEKDTNEGMEQLREYLATDGKELEHETQLQPFFALPFIEDPVADPFLSKIFDQYWLDQLTADLHTFIKKHKHNLRKFTEKMREQELSIPISPVDSTKSKSNILQKVPAKNAPIVPNDRNIPFFVNYEMDNQLLLDGSKKHDTQAKYTQTDITDIQISHNWQKQKYQREELSNVETFNKKSMKYSRELTLTKSHLHNIHSNYEKLKARFHKLHGDFHKLLGVAGELTVALETSVKGETVDLQNILDTCVKIFPDLFNRNIRDNSQPISVIQLDDNTEAVKQPNLNILPISPKLLDFKKIKLHLMNGHMKTKLFLLQALRWKLTLSPPGECDEVIHEYISNDLLGLYGQIANDNGKLILSTLLIAENIFVPHPLQQSTTRLLNAIASIRCGRDYLSVGPTVVNMIFKYLNTDRNGGIDSITCDMIVATLQKLSLRRQQRMYMIDIGIVEWLIYHLNSEYRDMGDYRLKYATALLMNLSLHRQAHAKVSKMASLVVSTLITLLSIDCTPALPYVNGILNNFLSNHVINDEAKRMNLSSVLEYYRKTRPGEIRTHLDHILKIHKREYTNNTENEDTADEDNEESDILENELEENDPVKSYAGELFGEALLATCYSLSPQVALEKPINVISDKKTAELSRESSRTTVSSSMVLATRESRQTEAEKMSSIASLENVLDYFERSKAMDLDREKEEEAFLAKPKLSRTPP